MPKALGHDGAVRINRTNNLQRIVVFDQIT
jgi:hypothetical protein